MRFLIVFSALMALTLPAEAASKSAGFTIGIRIVGKHGVTRGHHGHSRSEKKYTWGAAVISVARAKYRHIARIEMTDDTYWFETRRRGAKYRVGISMHTGEIVDVMPNQTDN